MGPRPPVVITAPVRSRASRTADGDLVGFVANRGAADDLDALRRKRARDVGGVRIDREAEEELVTNGDQLDLSSELKRRTPRRSAGDRGRGSR